jgi:molecular chaperone GrpE (heat shock protein)
MTSLEHKESLIDPIEQDLRALMRQVASLRTQVDRESRDAHKEQARLLLDVIEVLDAFDRTLALIEPHLDAAEPRARKWVASFGSIRRKLASQLAAHGVERIESPEGMVVPGHHRVTETRELVGSRDGFILEEVLTGYLWNGELLRASEVVAVKN